MPPISESQISRMCFWVVFIETPFICWMLSQYAQTWSKGCFGVMSSSLTTISFIIGLWTCWNFCMILDNVDVIHACDTTPLRWHLTTPSVFTLLACCKHWVSARKTLAARVVTLLVMTLAASVFQAEARGIWIWANVWASQQKLVLISNLLKLLYIWTEGAFQKWVRSYTAELFLFRNTRLCASCGVFYCIQCFSMRRYCKDCHHDMQTVDRVELYYEELTDDEESEEDEEDEVDGTSLVSVSSV